MQYAYMKLAEDIPKIKGACNVTYENNQYHICIPTYIDYNRDYFKKEVVAIDPGVRTFATCYDGAQYMEYGKEGHKYLMSHGFHLDNLQSKHDWMREYLVIDK